MERATLDILTKIVDRFVNKLDERLYYDGEKKSTIRCVDGMVVVSHCDLTMCVVEGDHTILYRFDKGMLKARQPLKDLEPQFKGYPFLRIDRNTVVNVLHVEKVLDQGDYPVLLKGNLKASLAEVYRKPLLALLPKP